MQFIENIDQAILMFIQNNMSSPFWDSFMVTVTAIGNAACVWIAIALILLFSTRYRKYGILLICTLLLCFIIGNLGLKPLIARARPYNFNEAIKLLIDAPADFSFPSGHTMSSFACAAILFYMNKKIGIAGYILAAVIAFSRLYLYVHYPSDVLAGLIIGILIAKIVIKLSEYIEKRRLNVKNNI